MEHISLHMLVFLAAAGFLAAFIDSVVGGGGLISIPALLLTGLPPSVVLGTNKLAGTMSSMLSTISFVRAGKVNLHLLKYLFPLSLLGSVLGTLTVRQVPSEFLKPMVVVMLVGVMLYTLLKKNWGAEPTYQGMTKKIAILSVMAIFGIGFYDGFFGAGTGSFLLFFFLLTGFDFVSAAGNAKGLNFASNLASLLTFMYLGAVNYWYGLPMGIAMLAGAWIGSRVAIRKGATYVRPLFLVVTIVMISKQLYDLIKEF